MQVNISSHIPSMVDFVPTPNLGLTVDYIRENITAWGVSPNQATRYVTEDGRTFYLYIDNGSHLNNNTVSRNLRGPEIQDHPDGIYTWIYFTDTQQQLCFETSHVVSPSELGTKHINLLDRATTYLDTLLLSGELSKKGQDYQINFYSGSTNMCELPDQNRIGVSFTKALKNILSLPSTAKVSFTGQAQAINNIHPQSEVLSYYTEMGYTLLFFLSEKECRDYHSYLLRMCSLQRNLANYQKGLREAQQVDNQRSAERYKDLISQIHSQLANKPVPIASSLVALSKCYN